MAVILCATAGFFIYKNLTSEKDMPVNEGAGDTVKTNTVQTKAVTTITSTEVNGYKINFTHSSFADSIIDESNKIDITKEGKKIWGEVIDQDFGGFYVDGVGDWIKDADDLKKKAIEDITGNGIPELIIKGYSGGAHCCFHTYIIELSNPISILFDLDTGNSGIEFKDLNNDGVMELVTNEDVFAYWYTSFAASPMPEVVLSLQNGKYRADPKYMRKAVPTGKEIKAEADGVESWSGAQGPEVTWKYAIDLIYSGNMPSAKKYVDLAWRPDIAGEFKSKEEFWRELDETIKDSPYYNDLAPFFNL